MDHWISLCLSKKLDGHVRFRASTLFRRKGGVTFDCGEIGVVEYATYFLSLPAIHEVIDTYVSMKDASCLVEPFVAYRKSVDQGQQVFVATYI